jgi:hypothetical protein
MGVFQRLLETRPQGFHSLSKKLLATNVEAGEQWTTRLFILDLLR